MKPSYTDLVRLLHTANRYLTHPDVAKVTNGFAMPGEVVTKRIEQAINNARAK